MSDSWRAGAARPMRRPLNGGGAVRRRRTVRLSWAELRLMVLGGAALGLGAVLIPQMEGMPLSGSGDVVGDAWAVAIIDGDTFDYRGERIRIADIDTPEVRGRCAYEVQLAARATSRMGELLRAGPFELHEVDRDRDHYGRQLRIVTRNGRSLGDQLVAEGLARTWTGRREPWC